jgi:hypothetical protein
MLTSPAEYYALERWSSLYEVNTVELRLPAFHDLQMVIETSANTVEYCNEYHGAAFLESNSHGDQVKLRFFRWALSSVQGEHIYVGTLSFHSSAPFPHVVTSR